MMLHLITPSEQQMVGVLCAGLILLMSGLLWYVLRRYRGTGA